MDISQFLTEERKEKLKDIVSKRQFDLTVVLENIHDAHNISAVLRSCDAVGIFEIYAIITDERIDLKKYEFHSKISSGSQKWVKIHIFKSVEKAIESIRLKYKNILGTHLSTESISLYDIDFSNSTALVFGNEHAGLSEELLSYLDGNFIIPQFGMVQSLNISVACAVSVFEASRQKQVLNKYSTFIWTENHENLYKQYERKSKERIARAE